MSQYTDERIQRDADVFKKQLLSMEEDNPKLKIFDNQMRAAQNVYKTLKDSYFRILYVMVIAFTQSGKTGIMVELIYLAMKKCFIPMQNIFIITGLSSVEWTGQMKERFPPQFHSQMFHLKTLQELPKKLVGKQNVLVIIDELHMAAKQKQTVSSILEECHLHDPDFTRENAIRVVEFSATPDGVYRDRVQLGSRSATVMAEPGRGYVGPFELLERGSVKEAKALTNQGAVASLITDIHLRYDNPRYHLVRLPAKSDEKKIVEDHFRRLSHGTIEFKTYQEKNGGDPDTIKNINNILGNVPDKHTVIFIKDKLRCAKTITKTYIGIVYERKSQKINDSSIIQSLLGRVTGYDVPADVLVYTSIDTIHRYKRLWDSEFRATGQWNSNTSKTMTYGIDDHCTDPVVGVQRTRIPFHHKFFTEEERYDGTLNAFSQRVLRWKPRDHGYDKIKEFENATSEYIASRGWGLSGKNPHRLIRGCDGVWVLLWREIE
jgi:hypothetical protein